MNENIYKQLKIICDDTCICSYFTTKNLPYLTQFNNKIPQRKLIKTKFVDKTMLYTKKILSVPCCVCYVM